MIKKMFLNLKRNIIKVNNKLVKVFKQQGIISENKNV